MIDTHCHLTYPALASRRVEVLAAARRAGVDRMITVGTTPDDAERAVALAASEAGVFATVGVHPHYAGEVAPADAIALLERFGEREEVAAIGEMGLDAHYPDPPLDVQTPLLEAQLPPAERSGKPIVIHNREATGRTLALLRASGVPGDRFVFHCFTGEADELDAILDFGATIGFTGIVTFNSARDLAEASDRVPMDRLLVETDSPYLTPAPHRKVRPNEPRYVVDVARFLAERRGMAYEAFVDRVDANAERLFGLPGAAGG